MYMYTFSFTIMISLTIIMYITMFPVFTQQHSESKQISNYKENILATSLHRQRGQTFTLAHTQIWKLHNHYMHVYNVALFDVHKSFLEIHQLESVC